MSTILNRSPISASENGGSERPLRRTKRNRSSALKFAAALVAAYVVTIVSVILFHNNDAKHRSAAYDILLDLPQVFTMRTNSSAGIEERRRAESRRQQQEVTTMPATSREESDVTQDKERIPTKTSDNATSLVSKGISIEEEPPKASMETCFPYNSKEWLSGPRLGNADDPLLTEDHAMEMILNTPNLLSGGTLHTLLNQTICHERSRFLNWTDDGSDTQSVRFWTLRLVYLAFHVHQHMPAMKEAKARKAMNGQCAELLRDHSVRTFDYECPDAKFLIVPMGELGLGAVMRLGAVNGLIAGMATNRTVLFVNNAPAGHKTIRKPWVHASCDRRDIQCFFLPPSPCVLTNKEIEEAYMLERGEARRMFRYGLLPDAHVNDRVLAVDIVLRPQRTPETLRPNLRNVSEVIIQEIREANDHDPRLYIMEKAAEKIVEVEPEDESRPYYYFGAQSKVHHAAVFYSLRPRPSKAVALNKLMDTVFPGDFDPELSFGLPVRASDKCLQESECLSFSQYMKLMGQVWTNNKHLIIDTFGKKALPTNATTSIVLTTESESIFRDKTKFQSDPVSRQSVPFTYRFVSNDEDVRQGTGLPTNFAKRNVTTDEIMMSAISSLKTQLMARFTVGNCCSNFHLLLFDFLRDGCGAARDNEGQCLQENKDPEFRVCCMWSRDDECQEKRNAKDAQKA